MKIKALDRIIIVIALLAIMLTAAISVSADSYYSTTMELYPKQSFYGSYRKFDAPTSHLKLLFDGTGSAGNWGENCVEPYKHGLFTDTPCGYREVYNWVDETWDNCPSDKYRFFFWNAGTTTWVANYMSMTSW